MLPQRNPFFNPFVECIYLKKEVVFFSIDKGSPNAYFFQSQLHHFQTGFYLLKEINKRTFCQLYFSVVSPNRSIYGWSWSEFTFGSSLSRELGLSGFLIDSITTTPLNGVKFRVLNRRVYSYIQKTIGTWPNYDLTHVGLRFARYHSLAVIWF